LQVRDESSFIRNSKRQPIGRDSAEAHNVGIQDTIVPFISFKKLKVIYVFRAVLHPSTSFIFSFVIREKVQ